jgi:hypothetical protein
MNVKTWTDILNNRQVTSIGDQEMIIFVVGEEKRPYSLQRSVVQSVSFAFEASLQNTNINAGVCMLPTETVEVFDEFAAWLSDRNRTWGSLKPFEYLKMVKFYVFALVYHIDDLKPPIKKALIEALGGPFEIFFIRIEKALMKADVSRKDCTAQVLDTVACELLFRMKNNDVDDLIQIYALADSWECTRFRNRVMDDLRDTLYSKDEVLTLPQVIRIFTNAPDLNKGGIRRFCVALLSYQRFSHNIRLSNEEALKYFADVKGFTLEHLEFEKDAVFRKFSDDYNYWDDPRDRRSGNFPRCYFHVHDNKNENEKCHSQARPAKRLPRHSI